jgi:hypothetical protein
MGNSPSRPPMTAPAVVKPAGGLSAVAAPMDVVTACRVKNVELSQLQNDVTRKQTEIDTCDPNEANRRRTEAKLQEFRSYVDEKEKIMNNLDSSIKSTLSTINSVYTSTKPTRSYINKLTNETNTLSKSQIDFEQTERTQRRNFLDNGPQDGVSGLLGVRTDDDKILLAFWIVYGIAIVSATFALLNVYGVDFSTSQKIQISLVVFVLCYGLAYYGITQFG